PLRIAPDEDDAGQHPPITQSPRRIDQPYIRHVRPGDIVVAKLVIPGCDRYRGTGRGEMAERCAGAAQGVEPLPVLNGREQHAGFVGPVAVAVELADGTIGRRHLFLVDDQLPVPVLHAALVGEDRHRDTGKVGQWRDVAVHAITPCPRRCSSMISFMAVIVRSPASWAISSGSALVSALTVTLTVGANVPEPDIVPEDATPYPL